jgi:hypothetical protein
LRGHGQGVEVQEAAAWVKPKGGGGGGVLRAQAWYRNLAVPVQARQLRKHVPLVYLHRH